MQVTRSSDQFPIRFPHGMRDKIKFLASQNGRSMNSEIIVALNDYIEKTTKNKKADATAS
ncbi:Arc family DNA-binding protein [Agrobacterium vitis]|uniref:Arc family DNA-binding protein n=1 Tax=Agrobacterium vitis TaxID=373 RepID=UPI001571CCA4|nr:Arc family DNA-binding protein [Agrobacterium vitis]NSY12470.1 Arc family DNA-binding protein [Agrobacterium vitis]